MSKTTYKELEKRVKELEKAETELKQEMEALQKTEKRFKDLIELLPEMVFETDNKGKITFVNTAVYDNLGYSKEDFKKGIKNLQLIISAEREKVEKVFEKGMSGEKLRINEYTAVRKDGSKFPFIVHSDTITDDNGNVLGLRSVGINITEHKKAEEALRESEEKFRTFMETASDLMHIADKDGKFTFVNASMAKTLGYTKEEMTGMHVTEIMSKEDVEKEFHEKWKKLITTGKISVDRTWVTKDGKEIYGEMRVVAIYDKNGTFAESRSVFRDISKRKNVEELLKKQKITVEQKNIALREIVAQIEVEKNEIKDNIIANIHEIIFPILNKLKLNEELIKYVKMLQNNLENISNSFGRKITKMKDKLTPKEIEISTLVKEGLTTMEISGLLNISYRTVESHRKNIRKKLGIINKHINLISYLQELQ